MIYTVTLNPALDYIVHTVARHPGMVQRAVSAKLLPAGKGLNVSLLLHGLGCPTRAAGFKAGWTGEAVESSLRAMGCAGPFFPLQEGMTRINVKLRHGQETDINLPGPPVDKTAWADLCAWAAALPPEDTVVFSGSVPPPLGSEAYAVLLACLQPGVRALVDTAGEGLLQALPLRPFLVKPNREELADLWGRPVRTPEDAIAGGKELLDNGAQNVLVSLGSEGAILLSPRGGWRLAAPCVQVQNTVGAGDSMLAGFLYGYDTTPGSREEKLPAALRFGVAAGSATAACEGIAGKDAVLATLARTGQPERLW